MIYFGYRTINSTWFKGNSERPFDPYLKSKNTSLDASLIAANEPSFKHTIIPPRAYCASRPPNNGESQWFMGTRVLSTVYHPDNVGFETSGTSCYPNVIWDFQNRYSTPDGLWKNPKHMSSPPAYLKSEGISSTIVEKEATNKI